MPLTFKNGVAFLTNDSKLHKPALKVGDKVLVAHFDNPSGGLKGTVKDFTLSGLVQVDLQSGFYGTGTGQHAFISQLVVHPDGIELDN